MVAAVWTAEQLEEWQREFANVSLRVARDTAWLQQTAQTLGTTSIAPRLRTANAVVLEVQKELKTLRLVIDKFSEKSAAGSAVPRATVYGCVQQYRALSENLQAALKQLELASEKQSRRGSSGSHAKQGQDVYVEVKSEAPRTVYAGARHADSRQDLSTMLATDHARALKTIESELQAVAVTMNEFAKLTDAARDDLSTLEEQTNETRLLTADTVVELAKARASQRARWSSSVYLFGACMVLILILLLVFRITN